jgi:hypothetical protein
MGQFGWVSVFRKIAFSLCSLKATMLCNFRIADQPRSDPEAALVVAGESGTQTRA